MAGKKESKPFKNERKWIETSSGSSNGHQSGLSGNLIEDVDKIEEIDCKQRWYATRLGRA